MIKIITLLGVLMIAPLPARAQTVQDQILTQLTAQGFHDFDVSRTLLGRIRVISKSDTLQRELVFNPVTGEILRDYWQPVQNAGTQSPRVKLTNPSRNDHDNATANPNPHTPKADNVETEDKDDDRGDDDKSDDRDDNEREDNDREDNDREDDDHEDDDK